MVESQANRFGSLDDACTSPASWSNASIHNMHPKSFVHSVNFLPDWSGWGVIKRIELQNNAQSLPGYVDAELYGKPGDLVAFPPVGFSPMGWIVSKSETNAEDAARNMDHILEHLVIDIDFKE